MHAVLVILFTLHYGAAMALFGAAAYRLVLADDPVCGTIDRGLRRVLLASAVLTLLSALAIPLAVTASMAGSWSGAADLQTLGDMLTGTAFGAIWWRRLILLVLAFVVTLATKPNRFWIAGVAALVLASLGLVGHAAMEQGVAGSLRRLTQAIHLLAAGGWLGGLIPLGQVLAASRAAPRRAVPALRRFSLLGAFAVAAVLVTGVLNTVALVDPIGKLAETDYGFVLMAKLALVAVLIGLALVNRFGLTPALENDPDHAASRLRATVLVEIAVGGLVVAVASLLGTLAPPIG